MLVTVELVDGTAVECSVSAAALERMREWLGDGGRGKVGLQTVTGARIWLRASEVRAVTPA